MSEGRSAVEGGWQLRERHHWLFRGDGRREAVSAINYVHDAMARSVCVRAAE